MTTSNSGKKIALAEALDRLPGPQGELSVGVFEHGSLVVKLYAPRGHDDQRPHSRDEVYVVARGGGELSVTEFATAAAHTMSDSLPRASSTALKILPMISQSGSFSMGRKAAR